jgi:hypothetical protein
MRTCLLGLALVGALTACKGTAVDARDAYAGGWFFEGTGLMGDRMTRTLVLLRDGEYALHVVKTEGDQERSSTMTHGTWDIAKGTLLRIQKRQESYYPALTSSPPNTDIVTRGMKATIVADGDGLDLEQEDGDCAGPGRPGSCLRHYVRKAVF